MAGNILPVLLLGGAAAIALKGKKKKKATTQAPPQPPDGLPLPPDRENEPPAPGETGFSTGTPEPPVPGKAVASGVERHYTGAYPWKILFTTEGDYAGHYYPMGHMGPHEEVVRAQTVEKAIEAFKFWANNEDRRKRNLPPILIAKAISVEPQPTGISE